MATKHRHGSGQPVPAPPARPAAPAVPETPPANILIPPQQTVRAHDEEVVRQRAYELWEQAGRPEGDGTDFWLQAEQELGGR